MSSRYRDGIHLCDLAVITRSADVTRAVATVVGVREKAFTRLESQLLDALASRRALVVLDNCEHVLEGAARLADRIIRSTRDVDILATSRERLAIDGEHLWEVRPLPVNGPDSPAVCLFVDRARATDAAFRADVNDLETVAEVCRQLDGLPLAIELAAARVRGLSLQDLAQHLDERFAILTAGSRTDGRHRSLSAVLDWSYAQLGPIEARVFDRLAVFAGPFGLDGACSVVAGDAVTPDAVIAAVLRLVDCALLAELPGSGARRYVLLETMRQYALDRLLRMTGWWLPEIDMLSGPLGSPSTRQSGSAAPRRGIGRTGSATPSTSFGPPIPGSLDATRRRVCGWCRRCGPMRSGAPTPKCSDGPMWRWPARRRRIRRCCRTACLPPKPVRGSVATSRAQQRPPPPRSKPHCAEPGRPAAHSRHALMWRSSRRSRTCRHVV